MIEGLIAVFVMLLLGGLALLAGWAVLGIIASLRTQNGGRKPGIDMVLDALQKWIYVAILAGEKLALQAMQDAEGRLTGTDKAAVANAIYDTLPDSLVVAGIALPIAFVKSLVPRDRFAVLVEDTYRNAAAFIARNEDFLKAQVKAITPEEKPNLPPYKPYTPGNDMIRPAGTTP